jgi:branched-subunit amino acid transport protein
MFVALGFAIFGFVARYLPIFPEETAHLPAMSQPQGVRAEVAVPVHAGD